MLQKKPGVVLAPSNAIDGIWHAHILHTKLYADFCSRLQGSFIHHEPGGGGVKAYEATLAAYEEYFQDLPPKFAWPPPAGAQLQEEFFPQSSEGLGNKHHAAGDVAIFFQHVCKSSSHSTADELVHPWSFQVVPTPYETFLEEEEQKEADFDRFASLKRMWGETIAHQNSQDKNTAGAPHWAAEAWRHQEDGFLTFPELGRCCLVCKGWKVAVESAFPLLEALDFGEAYPVTLPVALDSLRRLALASETAHWNLKFLDVFNTDLELEEVKEIVSLARNLSPSSRVPAVVWPSWWDESFFSDDVDDFDFDELSDDGGWGDEFGVCG